MSAKSILLIGAHALLIQMSLGQCTSRASVDTTYGLGWTGSGLAYDRPTNPAAFRDGLGWAGKGIACDSIHTPSPIDFTPTSGGGLVVTSGSPVPPTGISVVSDNAFEGALVVAGEVPFVGTTAVEGLLPAAGAGAIDHVCGDGVTAMVSEPTAPISVIVPEPVATVPAPLSFKSTAPSFGASPFSAPSFNVPSFNAPSFAAPYPPRAGSGIGNRLDYRGCNNRGLLY